MKTIDADTFGGGKPAMTRGCFAALILGAALGLAPGPADAHVVLTQSSFEAGANFAAFFKVEHGCSGAATTAMRVQIPDDVSLIQLPEKPGWTVSAERTGNRVTSVTWQGRLEPTQQDQFGFLVKLPAKPGALYFPTIQRCATAEIRWTDAAPGAKTPPPMLTLVAAAPNDRANHASPIAVERPWSRATPPGATTGVGYLTVMNHGREADVLLGGSSPQAAAVEVHQSSMTDGVMRMRPVTNGVPVPAGGTIELKPDGYHLMLTGLKAPLRSGTMLPVTLRFAKAGTIEVVFAVEPIGARGPSTGAATEHNHH